MSFFSRRSPIDAMVSMMRFVNKGKATAGKQKNVHISKRAQAGMFLSHESIIDYLMLVSFLSAFLSNSKPTFFSAI